MFNLQNLLELDSESILYDDENDDLTALIESIKKDGIMKEIVVIPNEKNFTIVHGNRRVSAAKMAGLKVAPYDKLYKLIETSHNSKDSWIKELHLTRAFLLAVSI